MKVLNLAVSLLLLLHVAIATPTTPTQQQQPQAQQQQQPPHLHVKPQVVVPQGPQPANGNNHLANRVFHALPHGWHQRQRGPATNAAPGMDKVHLEFYGESLCPYCQKLVAGELNRTLSAKGIWSILDYSYIPWGNAYYNTSACPSSSNGSKYDADARKCWDASCGRSAQQAMPPDCYPSPAATVAAAESRSGLPLPWVARTSNVRKICQHGEEECLGNRIIGCFIHCNLAPQIYSAFVYCFEGLHQGDTRQAEPCARALNVDWAPVGRCAAPDENNNEGLSVDVAFARRTAVLNPVHEGTPWVLLQGRVVTDYTTLLEQVCDAYTGDAPRPEGCPNAHKGDRSA